MSDNKAVPGSAQALRPVQFAYHVADPESAAHEFSRRYGWGPFFLLSHIPLRYAKYRGLPAVFDHSSAYGQAGELMVELICQHNDGPSALRDLYAPDDSGLHHVAVFVPSVADVMADYGARGIAAALHAETATGVEFAMLDTSAELGHMLEIYEPGRDLTRFYAYVRRAAENWNGEQPLRRLG
ncbi:MAG: VOC family protein [Steroidobacteraceae bacterium]